MAGPACADSDRSKVVRSSASRVSEAVPDSVRGDDDAREGGRAPAIVFLGTSLTAGYGLDPEQAYPALVQAKLDSLGLDYHVVNAGVSGETSAGGLGRIDWLLDQPVEILVLELGANDALRGQSPDALRANLQEIIDRTRAAHPEARVVVAGMKAPPNLGQRYVRRFERVFPELADENDAALIPFLLDGVAADPALNQPDGIHPTAEGHRIIAENVWSVLGPMLRGPGPFSGCGAGGCADGASDTP